MRTLSLNMITSSLNTPSRKLISVIALGLSLGTAGVLLLPLSHASQNEDASQQVKEAVITKINGLQAQVSKLQDAVNKPYPEVDLSAIGVQIQQLSKRLDAMQSEDNAKLRQTLSQTLEQSQTHLGNDIQSIKEAVITLNAKKTPVKYLKPEALPFKVVSIDSIQQVPVASIAYDYKTIPLEKGDTLAGWTILRIEYGKQRMELVNADKAHVVLQMNAVG